MTGGRQDEEVQPEVAAEACLGVSRSRVRSCLTAYSAAEVMEEIAGGLGKRCRGKATEAALRPFAHREGRVGGWRCPLLPLP